MTDRERDGLRGPVKAVLTDDVVLIDQYGELFEAQQASSISTYDYAGRRLSQTPYRINLTGGYAFTEHQAYFDGTAKAEQKERVKPAPSGGSIFTASDQFGNVVEGGKIEGNEKKIELSIRYDFDQQGNWIKRTISRLTDKNGSRSLAPAEASYRRIIYFSAATQPKPAERPAYSAGVKNMKNPIAADEENIAAGRALYLQRCVSCHGDDGRAQTEFAAMMSPRPAELTGQSIRALSDGEIFSTISEGVSSSGMPGLKGRISDQSIWKIVVHLRNFSIKKIEPPKADPLAKNAPGVIPERRYAFSGRIVSVEKELKQVMVDHEEVKGYMGAMTMPFPLLDEKLLDKLKKDDRIQATLVVDNRGWRLVNVVIK